MWHRPQSVTPPPRRLRIPRAATPLRLALMLAAGWCLAAPSAASAQTFTGRGQQVTRLFELPQTLMVFDVQYRGDDGPFLVRLMAEDGREVEQLARAEGRFGGSKAVGIPRAGRYLMDVSATGEWTIQVRTAASDGGIAEASLPHYTEGETAGAAEALRVGTGRWFPAGLVGGTLAGPLGAGIAVAMAGRSAVDGWPDPPPGASSTFRQGFEAAYESKVREGRRRRALIGGMVGSAVFVGALIAVLEVTGRGGAGDDPDPPPVDFLTRLPLPVPR